MPELPRPIPPQVLGANTLFGDRLDSIPDLRAAVGVDRVLDRALVVVNKKPRRPKQLPANLYLPLKLNGGGDRVRSATVEPALLVNGRALRSEIHSRRKITKNLRWGRVMQIAMVRQVRNPAVKMFRSAGAARQLPGFGFLNANPLRHASSLAKRRRHVDI